jgi:predicted Fe-Mo cluster-binding NifX family protein
MASGLRGKMKIAVVSENGKTISRHFGRASQYVIVKVDGGKILSMGIRPKASHFDFTSAEQNEYDCKCKTQGCGKDSYDRHRSMVLNILDCSVLLSGGMGEGAFEGLKSRGIQTVFTDVEDIETAVNLYIAGKLPNLENACTSTPWPPAWLKTLGD